MNEELESKIEESETDTARLRRILKEQVSFKEWADSLTHDFINLLTVISGYASLAQCSQTEVPHSYAQVELHTKNAISLIEKYMSRAGSAQAKEKLLHMLNNALTPVYGCAGIIKENPERLIKFNAQISAGIDCAVSIVKELQEFTNADMPTTKEPINILHVLEIALQENSGNKLNINRNYAVGSSHRVSANQRELSRMYKRMVDNAIEAGADTLHVSTYETDGLVCIKLLDNGKGMDDRDISHIFEPFYTTKCKNLGLSLATSKKIIEKYGGSIRFESKKWKGTILTIELPRYEQQS